MRKVADRQKVVALQSSVIALCCSVEVLCWSELGLCCSIEVLRCLLTFLSPSGAKVGKKKKVKGAGAKNSKSNGTCWASVPLPPPPMRPLPGTEVDLDHYAQENLGGGYDSFMSHQSLLPQPQKHTDTKQQRGQLILQLHPSLCGLIFLAQIIMIQLFI